MALLNIYSEIVNGERVWKENTFSFFCNTELYATEEKRRVLLREMSSIESFERVKSEERFEVFTLQGRVYVYVLNSTFSVLKVFHPTPYTIHERDRKPFMRATRLWEHIREIWKDQ